MVAARRGGLLVGRKRLVQLQEPGVIDVELLAAGKRGVGLLLLHEVAQGYHGLLERVLRVDARGRALGAEAPDA